MPFKGRLFMKAGTMSAHFIQLLFVLCCCGDADPATGSRACTAGLPGRSVKVPAQRKKNRLRSEEAGFHSIADNCLLLKFLVFVGSYAAVAGMPNSGSVKIASSERDM
jgi:hypothetical protein